MEEEKKWCVYIHRNIINDKAYIGIAKAPAYKRWGKNGNGYKKNQEAFYRAIQKYGWDNFEHIIWCENLTQEEAKEWEVILIALFKTNCSRYKNPERGYNLTDGGDGMSGFKFSEESKIKMSQSKKGKKLSEDHKEKLRKLFSGENNPMHGKKGKLSPAFGRKYTEEQRTQKSIRMMGNTNMLGKKHSDETKNKIRESKRNISDKTREKMSKAQRGKIMSEESKRKNSDEHKGMYLLDKNPNAKRVFQYDIDGNFIKEYGCAQSASLETGINANLITACCRNEQKTAGGFIWKR